MHIIQRYAQRLIQQCGGDSRYNWSGCGGTIKAGSQIIEEYGWHNKRRWAKYTYSQCFLPIFTEWWDVNPFSPQAHNAGRKPRDITLEERRQRRLLLVKASKLRRQKHEKTSLYFQKGLLDDFYQQADKFNQKLQEVWDQLLSVGGPPHKSFSEWTIYTVN